MKKAIALLVLCLMLSGCIVSAGYRTKTPIGTIEREAFVHYDKEGNTLIIKE